MTEHSTSEDPLDTRTEKPKVIYVLGAGRSGSTLLGVALGNCENVFYAGELDAWLRRSGIPNFGGLERKRFWKIIRDDVDGTSLFGSRAWRYLEHSLAPFRIWSWPGRRRLRQRYRRIAEDLYYAIAHTAEMGYIVDSSHYPLRARELQRLSSIDLYLVYLVRDPQSVVASFNRQDVAQLPRSPVVANIYLWLTHLLSVFVFLHHPRERRLFLRYENFIADPQAMLLRVVDGVNISTKPPDVTSLDTGIPFQGNRLLRSETISIESGTGKRSHERNITALLQLPWIAVLSLLRPVAQTSVSSKQASASESS